MHDWIDITISSLPGTQQGQFPLSLSADSSADTSLQTLQGKSSLK